jgi:hypothetical protein
MNFLTHKSVTNHVDEYTALTGALGRGTVGGQHFCAGRMKK